MSRIMQSKFTALRRVTSKILRYEKTQENFGG